MSLIKSVNFGSDETGLTTVGYTLINSDGSIKQSRTTTGIFEVKTNAGIYSANIDFDSTGWNGIILWDTGENEPIYASEEFNYKIDGEMISDDLKRLLGLSHENIFIDLTNYDEYNNLISARIRIYSNDSDVGTSNNVITTYYIDCNPNGAGKFISWQQTKI